MAKKILTQGYLIYPDSAPENFFELITDFLGENVGFKYILHDKDVDKDGNLKKAHYHILFDQMLSRAQWKYIENIGKVKHHEDFFSPSGAEKYLTHEDNEEKYHYNADDVKCVNWNDDIWSELIEKEKKENAKNDDKVEEGEIVSKIITAIMENDIHDIQSLTKYVVSNMTNDDLMVVVKRAYFFVSFMKG